MECKFFASIGLFFISTLLSQAEWFAQPIDVHEWGVSEYNWLSTKVPLPEVPDFFYTDEKPGIPVPSPSKVKDSPPDTGVRVRTKPILYFYRTELEPGRFEGGEIPIGVEVRFRDGAAYSWWPQVSIYRDAKSASQAVASGLNQEESELVRSKSIRNSSLKGKSPFPDDERFQLVWNRLTLTMDPPKGIPFMQDNSISKWVQIAREIDSDFVSNGKEFDKFVFYEGKTQELPAVALVPYAAGPTMWTNYLVCNISDYPIHDVIVIYRNRTKGHYWVDYAREIQPVRPRRFQQTEERSLPHVVSLRMPDFDRNTRLKPMDEEEMLEKAKSYFLKALTMEPNTRSSTLMELRRPEQYQPKTEEYRLYPKELAVIERIWKDEFFNTDGLTIIYRESLSYLDEAVPLKIYTDMSHYVNLSRCSLVVNHQIQLESIHSTEAELRGILNESKPAQNDSKGALPQKLRALFERHPFITLGLLQYYVRSENRNTKLRPWIDELAREISPKR